MQKRILFSLFLLCIIGQSGCRTFYPNIMFKLPKDYPITALNQMEAEEYHIQPGDKMNLRVFSNEAYNQVNSLIPAFENSSNIQQNNMMSYLVRQDSLVELPIIGLQNLVGLTIPAAQEKLKSAYTEYYNEPFVLLEVINRRVIVFNGSDNASIVALDDENMSLVEVLGQAGGIQVNGKAFRIKLIRGDLENPQVAIIDLSTLEGMKEAEMTVQANDIIYIETTSKITTGFLRELSPIVGIITSIASIYVLIRTTSLGN